MFDMDKAMEDFIDIARRLVVKAYNSGIITGAKAEKEKNAYCDEARKCAYEDGLKDAWDCARKITELSAMEYDEIFGDRTDYPTLLTKFSPQEVMEKLKKHERKQKEEEIQVGDEVRGFGKTGVVIGETRDNFSIIMMEYDVPQIVSKEGYTKTGKHFSQLTDALKLIRGKNNA